MPQCLPGSDLVLLSASIAIGISNDLSADDTAVLSGVFMAIGDNLAIIAAKKQACGNKAEIVPDTLTSSPAFTQPVA